jgi:hypothetical protein
MEEPGQREIEEEESHGHGLAGHVALATATGWHRQGRRAAQRR